MSARHRRSPRGFTLVVAAALLTLANALVDALMRLALNDSLATTFEVAEVQADYIAETGLLRTSAWLAEVSRTEVDFDAALDPSLDDTCTYAGAQLNVTDPSGDDHVPEIGGAGIGTISQDPGPGRSYRKVPFGGGAYYVRVDDNSDDGHEGWNCPAPSPTCTAPCNGCGSYWFGARNNYYVASTNNHDPPGSRAAGFPGTPSQDWGGGWIIPAVPPPACPESNSPEINQLQDNRVRDRDKLVQVTVIGIYPGTNWDLARGRKAYRLLVGPARQVPVLVAKNDVTLGGNNHVCGFQGGVAANGNITVNAGGCQCGDFTAGGPTCPATAAMTACDNVQCPNPAGGATAACVPATGQDSFQPFTINSLAVAPYSGLALGTTKTRLVANIPNQDAQCVFLLGRDGVIYFWDRLTRTNCRGVNPSGSDTLPRPCGPATAAVRTTGVGNPYDGVATNDALCDCWIPVFYPAAATAASNPNPYAGPTGTSCADRVPVAGAYCPLNGAAPGPGPYGMDDTAGPNWDVMVANGTCRFANDCEGDSWKISASPTPTAAGVVGHSYNWPATCPMPMPWVQDYNANPARSWHWTGATWQMEATATPGDVPPGIYFADVPGQTVALAGNTATSPFTIRLVTPGAISSTAGLDVEAPNWARDYVLVSNSSCTLAGGTAPNPTNFVGQILCQGNITTSAGDFILNGRMISANGSIVTGANQTFSATAGSEQWESIPVVPFVWSDGTF